MKGPGVPVRRRLPYTLNGLAPSTPARPLRSGVDCESPLNATYEEEQLEQLLASETIAVGASSDDGVRRIAWSGLPPRRRAEVWRLLAEYAPPQRQRQARELRRKREEYAGYVAHYYDKGRSQGVPQEKAILSQLSLDLPRHKMCMFHEPAIVLRLERCLYIWSLRHPAVGYVQGMDDLLAIFFIVFLADHLTHRRALAQVSTEDLAVFMGLSWTEEMLDAAEADAYWCGGRMLGWVQDHFVTGQPGIRALLRKLDALLAVVDEGFADDIAANGIQISDFCFPWMHCLLARELSPLLTARLWDTYLSLGSSFSEFHVYVCVALLMRLKPSVMGQAFDVMLRRLQNPLAKEELATLPVTYVDELVAEAYVIFVSHPPKSVFSRSS
jgi:hypothetical protein